MDLHNNDSYALSCSVQCLHVSVCIDLVLIGGFFLEKKTRDTLVKATSVANHCPEIGETFYVDAFRSFDFIDVYDVIQYLYLFYFR